MIPRYTPQDIEALWSDAHRVKLWLEVELAALDAMAKAGIAPQEDAQAMRRFAEGCDYEALARRADEIEAATRHDVIAFLTAVEEGAGPSARFVHYGLTSSDVLDTAFALRLRAATGIIAAALTELGDALARRAAEHRDTPMIGRSHGVHAEPVTMGFVLAGFLAEVHRNRARLRAAQDEISVGKLSGAVGTNAHLPFEVEEEALAALGLKPDLVVTQVVPRDRHAMYFQTLSVLAAGVERISVTVRHWQRTEVREAQEPFGKGQKGSSAMPHKKNPILTENLTGLARLVRAWASSSTENVALWHERDISHSSVERVIAPDATAACVFMLRRITRVIDGLVVYPERMAEHLAVMRGLPSSQTVLLALIRAGMHRQKAYEAVQRAALRVWDEDVSLMAALQDEADVRSRIEGPELERMLATETQLARVGPIVDRTISAWTAGA